MRKKSSSWQGSRLLKYLLLNQVSSQRFLIFEGYIGFNSSEIIFSHNGLNIITFNSVVAILAWRAWTDYASLSFTIK